MTSDFIFSVREDFTIVGNNSEMADSVNPRGDLEGSVFYVVAEDSDGRRFAHDAAAFTINGYAINGDPVDRDEEDFTVFRVNSHGMTVERLERLASYLNANHPVLDSRHWTEIQACYGSDAYQRDGWEEVAVAIERDEARFGG